MRIGYICLHIDIVRENIEERRSLLYEGRLLLLNKISIKVFLRDITILQGVSKKKSLEIKLLL